ncbi:uncharacterized protein N0V96_003163 [Colletotrichum fioriniae]|uniref:uncharacterized protein n=1 Tax=Colletotrichum fioriniae TaxID=710243 RepID=UPI0032DB596E|nr:hypothetical protein N0V96_003163 [Colletotrichum fioriniae]
MQPPARSLSQTTTLKPLDDGPTGAGGITLPSEDEARRLFESMTFFIGYTQHHIDTREFSDRLAFFYANLGDTSQAISQVQMPWYLEMLLVFAIGKLFSGGFDGEEKGGGLPVPGASMFAHVQARLPSLSELYGLGKLGIEIHALAAVYLQNANRKEEARLAAATGNPAGILDDVIEIDMPTDSPGFPPALPLRTNIKIARVTGRILSSERSAVLEEEG